MAVGKDEVSGGRQEGRRRDRVRTLDVGVVLEGVLAELATDTRLLVAT
jgi:hypothetical protein